MSPKRKTEGFGCKELQRLKDAGDLDTELLAHTSAGEKDSTLKPSTLHLVKIASSIGKSPCEYLAKPGNPCPPTCRLIAKGVTDNTNTWDIYLMNCHYGPPCDLFNEKRLIKMHGH